MTTSILTHTSNIQLDKCGKLIGLIALTSTAYHSTPMIAINICCKKLFHIWNRFGTLL